MLQASDLREKGLGVTVELEEARPGPSPTPPAGVKVKSPEGAVDWRSLFTDMPQVHWLTVSGLDEGGCDLRGKGA